MNRLTVIMNSLSLKILSEIIIVISLVVLLIIADRRIVERYRSRG